MEAGMRLEAGCAHESSPLQAVWSRSPAVQHVGSDVRHFVAEHFQETLP
jgi:hypothetical protein